MERAADAMNKLANNNTVVNVLLMSCFGLLSLKTYHQQNQIKALEAEKESVTKANKSIKKAIWDWKQQLFAEAQSPTPLFPLPKLRAIYGETPPTLTGGEMQNKVEKSQKPRLLI